MCISGVLVLLYYMNNKFYLCLKCAVENHNNHKNNSFKLMVSFIN